MKNRSWINGSTYVRKVDDECFVVTLWLCLATVETRENTKAKTADAENKKRGGRTWGGCGVGGQESGRRT